MTATVPPNFDQAWRSLSAAAERVGAYQWARAHARRVKPGKYTPTTGHRVLVDGMKGLSYSRITPEQAMALLHWGEGAEELGKARRWESAQRKKAAALGQPLDTGTETP